MAFYRQLGCCGALGQLEPGETAAIVAPELPGASGLPRQALKQLFFLSVGAGLTVWAVTRFLDKRGGG